MALRRGDIVIAAQGELGRPRPVVVVQADELGETTTTVLACPITSVLTQHLPVRPTVQPETSNGLQLVSQVMTDKLLPVRRDRISRTIGALDSKSIERLDRALLLILGLSR
jgi:mRNA interferase MazF